MPYYKELPAGAISTLNSTTTPLSGGATYTGTWEEIYTYASISVIGSTDANGTLYFEFSTDASTVSRSVQLSTGTDTSLGIHSLIPVAQYGRVKMVNGAGAQSSLDIQVLYHPHARIAQPTSRLGQSLTTYSDVLNTRAIIANTAGTNVAVTDHSALQVTPPREGKSAFGEQLQAQLVDQFNLNFVYGVNSDLVYSRANQSGSITGANSLGTATTGAAANSSGEIRTIDILRYVPGHGSRVRFTALFTTGVANSTQYAGLIDESNGVAFGYNGTAFGILQRKGGAPEIRTLTVTTGSSHDEDITITLDGDAKSDVSVTNTGSTTETANEIAAADYSDVGRGWDAKAYGATVVFTAWDSGSKSGTYSLSSATSAVGTFAQTLAGASPTDTWTAQASWNGDDIFDGNGLTGVTLDPTKGNVYQIDLQWLGFGTIGFFIEDPDDGELHLVHTIEYSNANTTPSLDIPHLPVSFLAENTSNTSSLSVSTASVGAFTDGLIRRAGPRRVLDTSTAFGASSTAAPVIMLENKPVFASKRNRVKVQFLSIAAAATVSSGNSVVAIELIKNPTLVGASFSDVGSTSPIAYAVNTGNTVTTSGGSAIAGANLLSSSQQLFEGVDDLDLIMEPGDVWAIVADPSANNTTVYVVVRWVELV